jgi:parvulin-like peptidyl-prolyl isomerase
MLENMRRGGASIFVYIVFGGLVVIFVLGINPGGNQSSGCGTQNSVAVTVDGIDANENAFQVAFNSQYNPARGSEQRKYHALDTLILREMLAQAAEERNIRVSEELIDEEIKKGNFFYSGQRLPLRVYDEHEDGTRTWNFKRVKAWIAGHNVSIGAYKSEQRRSMQATLMAELLTDSVTVSREEALDDFIYEGTTVTYDSVVFSPPAYRAVMKLTDADIARFLTTREAEVKARFTADERLYSDPKAQVKVRQIFIAKSDAAPTPTPAPGGGSGSAAGSAAGSGSAAPAAEKPDTKKPGMTIEAAKAKLEAARAEIAAGKKKFADVVKELSSDETQKANGGDMGWRNLDNAQLGDVALNNAVKGPDGKGLKVGEMTPVTATDAGVFLIVVEGARGGDKKALTYEQVKHEIAAELARDVWSKEAAKRDAITALEKVSGGKHLSETFEPDSSVPGALPAGLEKILNDPSLTPEQKKQLLEQFRNMGGGGGPQGSIEWEGTDIPVAWKGGDDDPTTGSSGSAAKPAKPAAGSASIKLPEPGPAKPAAGSAAKPAAKPAAGSAAKPPAAGAGSAGSAAPTTPAPTTPVAGSTPALTPSTDVLPAFGTVALPKVHRHGPYPRMPQLPSAGKEGTRAMFEEIAAGKAANRVYETDGSYAVLEVIEKGEPKVEDFDKDAAKHIAELRRARAAAALIDWAKTRCELLKKEDKIKPAPRYVVERGEDGKDVQTYQPCTNYTRR